MSKCEDPLVDCPLDRLHRIRTSRLQFHLVKCLKNHSLSVSRKVKCPYNPLHIVDAVEILHHCESCYDSAPVLLEKYDLEGEKGYSGIISIEQVNAIYDAEIPKIPVKTENTHTGPAYDPNINIESKPIFRQLIGESKSKRKKFRLRERQRIAALEAENKTIFNASVPEPVPTVKPLRKPHILSTTLTKTPVAKYNSTDEGISNTKENEIPVVNGTKPKIRIAANSENKEDLNPTVIKKQNNNFMKNESNIEEKNDKLHEDLNHNIDIMGNIVVDSLTDAIKQLKLLEEKENIIQQRKMQLKDLISKNNWLVQPKNSTISYRDAAVIKSNEYITDNDENPQPLQNKSSLNINNGDSGSIINLRQPKLINHPQISNQ